MRKGNGMAAAIVAGALLLAAPPARALITALTPLQDVLHQSTFIVSARVESVDAHKPAMVLIVEEDFKGRLPLRKLPVLLKGDAVAKKKNHVPLILKRVAAKMPILLFILQQGKNYTAFVYTNGTWFQIVGVQADGAVRWRFTHGEPYLRKTFKGSTAELKQTVVDGLAGKKAPPKPDTKVKPGFGPEIKAEQQSRSRGSGGGALFAVIPTVLGGPLALLALLFPAVFGGLTLVMRRWMAALSVLSLNSTLYFLQQFCLRWLAGSWWGTPQALWRTMMVVTLLGMLWAWRRHLIPLPQKGQQTAAPGRVEWMTLAALTFMCLGMAASSLPRTLVAMTVRDKMLLMFGAGLAMAALHALYRRWAAVRGRALQPGLPGEGILLWTMLLASIAFSTTWSNASGGAGIREDADDPAATGWRRRVAWRFRPNVERSWMASSPRRDGERIYVGVVLPSAFGGSGAVYCLDRQTGKEIWMFNDDGAMKDVFSSPCLADGRLYIGEGFHQHADCKLYCLDAASGRKLWDFATASHTESTPCVAAGKVYFGAGDDGLYCLDAATGREKWHLKGLHVDANPLVIDNRLYGGSGVGDAYKETVLFCLNADTGDLHWRVPVDLPVWGMPAVQGEYVYAGIGNGNFLASADQLEEPAQPAGAVLCRERASGRHVWRYDVGDGVLARVCVDGEHVWFAARDRHCYCLDRRDGTLRWKTDLGSPIVASPTLAGRGDGMGLYVAGSNGLLSRLDPRTGRIGWRFDVAQDADQPATVFSSPLVQVQERGKGESRWIWFGCGLSELSRGILYCLEERTVETSE